MNLVNLNGHIEEIYSGLNVVKVYNGKNESDKKFDELNKSVYECNRKSQFLSGLMMPIMNFIGNFGYVAVCIVGALLTIKRYDYIWCNNCIYHICKTIYKSTYLKLLKAMTSLQSTAAASRKSI